MLSLKSSIALFICLSTCMSATSFGATGGDAAKLDVTPPAPDGALKAEQIPPMATPPMVKPPTPPNSMVAQPKKPQPVVPVHVPPARPTTPTGPVKIKTTP